MKTTARELARRLRQARQAARLRQEDVAARLGISRTAVVHIEAGRRSVSGLELERMSQLYGRDMGDFFSESFSTSDAVAAFFRLHPDLAGHEPAANALREAVTLGRAFTGLERVLGVDRDLASVAQYSMSRPRGKWEAVRQGGAVAEQERRRLGLGDHPLPDLVELFELQGVRAANRELPEGVSGLTLMDPAVGALVLVNAGEPHNKRRFSYAHEYAHVLLDREKRGVMSRLDERDTLPEVRANAFAASFLLPREGVFRFVRALAKGTESRERLELREELEDPVSRVEGRPAPGSQTLQIYDVALVAHHFGVSRVAAIYRLRNLRLIRQKDMESLLQQERNGAGSDVANLLGLVAPEPAPAEQGLGWRFLALGIEALRREEISRAKLRELSSLIGMDAMELEQILAASGLARPPADVLDPHD